jgi:hypothetical protein
MSSSNNNSTIVPRVELTSGAGDDKLKFTLMKYVINEPKID